MGTTRLARRHGWARLRALALEVAAACTLALLAASLAGCGADGSNTDSAAPGSDSSLGAGGSAPQGSSSGGSQASGGTSGSGGSTGGTGAQGGAPQPPPPEMELESAFEAPVATDRYVWTANPTTGKVALIDAGDFSVRLAEAGIAPTTVAALPGNSDEDAAATPRRSRRSTTRPSCASAPTA